MVLPLKNKTFGKICSLRSYLSSLILRRDSHSQIRTKLDNDRQRRLYKRNVGIEDKKECDGLFLCKSKGQHLLTNNRILDAIVRSSNVRPTDTVLEIGPGTGNLTMKLLEAAHHVIAVEIDTRMVEILRKRVSDHGFANKLTIIQKDVLKTDFPEFNLVVANIPYNISSPLIAKLVYGSSDTFRSATLLLQKEFSRRLLSNPGDSDFNRLAVNVKLVADVKFVMDVSKREFVPPPKVDSSVVMITPKEVKPDVNVQEWLAFTRTCFGKKNKTLGSMFRQKKKVTELLSLSTGRNVGVMNQTCNSDSDVSDVDEKDDLFCLDRDESMFKERMIGVLRSNGFEEKRPSKLCHGELLHLLSLFNQAGIFFHDNSNTSLPLELHE